MSCAETIEERGNYRVRLVLEEYAEEPHNDGGCPIIRIIDGRSARFEHTGYGGYYDAGLDAERVLSYFTERFGWRDALDVFERYVRIFHEGSVETYNVGVSREYGYVAFTTRTLAREWGILDSQPVPAAELDDWRAYCEGDVYGYVIEERVTWQRVGQEPLDALRAVLSGGERTRQTWEEVDSCWGHYGREWAEQAAREAFDYYAPTVQTA